jgi:hypothetical protein
VRERETETKRERVKDRDRERDRARARQRQRKTATETERETERETDRETEPETDRETEREIERDRERERVSEGERDRERVRERERRERSRCTALTAGAASPPSPVGEWAWVDTATRYSDLFGANWTRGVLEARGDREWPLNEAQRPRSRGVRVAPGYEVQPCWRAHGRARRNGGVSSSSARSPLNTTD